MFGSILSAAASIGGGLLGKEGAEDQNHANAKQAQLNRDFQERMSNTSYQRGMKDMKKAGLNPMLAFMKGGASTPSGAQAEMVNEQAPLAKGVSESAVNAATVQNLQATSAKSEAEATKAIADTDLAAAQAAETRARTPNYEKTGRLTEAQIDEVTAKIGNLVSSTSLNQAQGAKVREEILNLSNIRDLTKAQISEALSRAKLTTAQIREVEPRIEKILADAAYTRAGTDFQRFKSDLGNFVNVPSARSLVEEFGRFVGDSAGAARIWFSPDSTRRNWRNPRSK